MTQDIDCVIKVVMEVARQLSRESMTTDEPKETPMVITTDASCVKNEEKPTRMGAEERAIKNHEVRNATGNQ